MLFRMHCVKRDRRAAARAYPVIGRDISESYHIMTDYHTFNTCTGATELDLEGIQSCGTSGAIHSPPKTRSHHPFIPALRNVFRPPFASRNTTPQSPRAGPSSPPRRPTIILPDPPRRLHHPPRPALRTLLLRLPLPRTRQP